MECKHLEFEAKVSVGRLTKDDNDPNARVVGYVADIKITCAQCNLPFEFCGLPMGVYNSTASTDITRTELRAPLQPSTDPAEQVKVILK